ncbi:hypothetical protein NUW54_g13547 [Trametes sanguinea]|uniref:Uncharacterized protein n=1 Tax=Trametes sanguinea TaxID=158606 RepID=A0ACC1MLY7_9APHY|nr:hypothetical protein NUW54_g13547 [Trametes sanguinea]
MPRLTEAVNDRRAVTIFCDGSMFPKPRCRTGAAFRAYRAGRLLVRRGIAGGRGTSYDAEMLAGGMGLAFATKQACETIHVVADNESALETLLDPGMHDHRIEQRISVLLHGHGLESYGEIRILGVQEVAKLQERPDAAFEQAQVLERYVRWPDEFAPVSEDYDLQILLECPPHPGAWIADVRGYGPSSARRRLR